MVTLRKQMRAFCLMCQRYLTNVNTAVKEQVMPHLNWALWFMLLYKLLLLKLFNTNMQFEKKPQRSF